MQFEPYMLIPFLVVLQAILFGVYSLKNGGDATDQEADVPTPRKPIEFGRKVPCSVFGCQETAEQWTGVCSRHKRSRTCGFNGCTRPAIASDGRALCASHNPDVKECAEHGCNAPAADYAGHPVQPQKRGKHYCNYHPRTAPNGRLP